MLVPSPKSPRGKLPKKASLKLEKWAMPLWISSAQLFEQRRIHRTVDPFVF